MVTKLDTIKGRDWLAMHGRPIVEGDPINDMDIVWPPRPSEPLRFVSPQMHDLLVDASKWLKEGEIGERSAQLRTLLDAFSARKVAALKERQVVPFHNILKVWMGR